MSDCARTEEILIELLDDGLESGERASLEGALSSHLEGCAACREVARVNGEILKSYRAVPEVDVSGTVANGILAAAKMPIPAEDAGKSRKRVVRAFALVAAAASILIVVVARDGSWWGRRAALPSAVELVLDGDAQVAKGSPDRAVALYERALEAADDEATALVALARLSSALVSAGEFERALQVIDQLVERAPDERTLVTARLLRGEALGGAGSWPEAFKQFELVAEESPWAAEEAQLRAQQVLELHGDELGSLSGLGYVGD